MNRSDMESVFDKDAILKRLKEIVNVKLYGKNLISEDEVYSENMEHPEDSGVLNSANNMGSDFDIDKDRCVYSAMDE